MMKPFREGVDVARCAPLGELALYWPPKRPPFLVQNLGEIDDGYFRVKFAGSIADVKPDELLMLPKFNTAQLSNEWGNA